MNINKQYYEVLLNPSLSGTKTDCSTAIETKKEVGYQLNLDEYEAKDIYFWLVQLNNTTDLPYVAQKLLYTLGLGGVLYPGHSGIKAEQIAAMINYKKNKAKKAKQQDQKAKYHKKEFNWL